MDDQELSVGLYGSGMVLYGNMELNAIDHIEIYTGNPTYEFSTEPTFILVKLYSKTAQKDGGSKVIAQVGNYADSLLSFYNSDELSNGWSYFAYAAQNNAKRQKYRSHNTELSRDKLLTNVFTSFYNANNKILLNVGRSKQDSFIDQSLDASPQDATIENDFLHLGYNGKQNNLSYLLSYDVLNAKTNFRDDFEPITSLETDSKSFVISSELKYNYTTDTNKFITGIKYRYKGFQYDKILRNHIDVPRTGNTHQTIATPFIENQYSLKENSIITTGISASKMQNNHSVQNRKLQRGHRRGKVWKEHSCHKSRQKSLQRQEVLPARG